MSHFQLAQKQHFLHRFGQSQQAQAVRHRAAAAPHRLGHGFMREAEFVHQALQTLGLFNRIEVFALDVFNQTHRQRRFVADAFNHHRNFGQTRQLAGTPTAFAGNQFVLRQAVLAHNNRLNHALRLNRIGQLLQAFVVHLRTRLVAPRLDVAHRHAGQPVAAAVAHRTGQQRIQAPAAEAAFRFCHLSVS